MAINTEKTVYCKFCRNFLGERKQDGQTFRMGKSEVYHRTKIFCTCGWFFMFIPAAIPDDVLTEQQKEFADTVRIKLAKSKNTELDYDK